MPLPGFDLVDLFNRMQIDRIHCQPIESVRGQRNNIALAQAGDNIVNPVWLGLIGMDAQDLRGQNVLPQFPEIRCRKVGN